MLAAILGFLGSVISALPKLIETIRDWKKAEEVAANKTAKDNRNESAISEANSNNRNSPGV